MTLDSRDPLDLVSLRQLRYFSAAMQSRSFNEAAQMAHISQPALSGQIAALEESLGVQLFDRSSGRATPTLPAQQLFLQISASLGDLQSALRQTRDGSQTVSGLVRVGLVQSYGACWVVPVTRAAQERWPDLSISLHRRTAQALTEGVLRGDIDLAVSFDPQPHTDLDVQPYFVEPFVAIGNLPPGLARIDVATLSRCKLALLPGDHLMRRQIDVAFAAAGQRPLVHLESDSLDDLVFAAQHRGMVAILNAAAVSSLGVRDGVLIDVPGLQRTACVLRSRSRYQTHAAQYLWEALGANPPVLPSCGQAA
jgi:LysR family cyn operon transcriptional activator